MTTILWLKALHVGFMVSWFAGIFYLPRLFVNHANTTSTEVIERLKAMERRLLLFVTPFAFLTVAFGMAIIANYGGQWFVASKWLHIKLLLVIILLGYHGYCFKLLKDFKLDRNKHSEKFYRIYNEVPVIMLFAIVILVYVKPSI